MLLQADFSLAVVSKGDSLVVVHRLLIVVASLAAGHRLEGTQASVTVVARLWSTSSIVVAPRLSCCKHVGSSGIRD